MKIVLLLISMIEVKYHYAEQRIFGFGAKWNRVKWNFSTFCGLAKHIKQCGTRTRTVNDDLGELW